MNEAEPTFTQKETIDKPGIIGARWWQESLAKEVPRRKAIQGLLVMGGVLGAVGLVGFVATRKPRPGATSIFSSEPEVAFTPKTSLDLQKEYGWNFGATGDPLVFDGTSTAPFDRKSLDWITSELAPGNEAYAPYFIPTLFQSPAAMPTSKPSGDPDAPAFKPLKDVIVPILTPAMKTSFEQGKALAAVLLSNPNRMKDLAVIVDLPGPLAVAFAAGASSALDPVFLFDNWPHPLGVVPAHTTLAAAIYYQPLFASARARNAKARPMFVLDRTRLSTYVDSATQFDNRHTARVPSTANMTSAGVKNVLYVGPNAIDRSELDDLADDFLTYQTGGILFHLCPAMAFERPATELFADAGPVGDAGIGASGGYMYGGTKRTSTTFWTDWDSTQVHTPNEVQAYVPKARATQFSTGSPVAAYSSHVPRRPEGFGTTEVAIAVATGAILGARASRSGSWNRTTSTSSSS